MGSHYKEARRNDPDVVDVLMAMPETEGARWRPRGEDVSLTAELLMRLLDRLGDLTSIEASHPLPRGAKVRKAPEPFPRPLRLIDRRRAEADVAYFNELDDEVQAAQERWAARQEQHALDTEAEGG